MNVSGPSVRLFSLWDTPAFSVGDEEYAWIDVALWAMASGAWATFERQLAAGLACVVRANAEHSGPSEQELDEAATAFRYDRDLLAAAEVNDWLEGCDLSVEDWTAYLRRGLLRERWRETLDETLHRHPPSTAPLVAAAYAEGVCSGALETFADSAAARVALAAASGRPAVRLDESGEAETLRLANAHACWLSSRPAADTRLRLVGLPRLRKSREILAAHTEVVQRRGHGEAVFAKRRRGMADCRLQNGGRFAVASLLLSTRPSRPRLPGQRPDTRGSAQQQQRTAQLALRVDRPLCTLMVARTP